MVPLSGAELVRMMRNDKYLRDIPVILTSGNAAVVSHLFGDGKPLPATSFILKPFHPKDLKRKLSEVLEGPYQKEGDVDAPSSTKNAVES
jgi:CheY-like chemotaxis protein